MTDKPYHHGDLKTALIQGALDLLSTQGSSALSLRSLAAHVGVSHMAPYAHFKNKTQLMQAIAHEGFSMMEKAMIADSQNATKPADQILSYGATYIDFALSYPALYSIMLSQYGPSHTLRDAPPGEVSVRASGPHQLLLAAFQNITKESHAASIRAIGAWASVHGYASLLLEGHFSIPQDMSTKDFLAQSFIVPPRPTKG